MMEKYRLTSEGNGWKNAQNGKIIINTIYMKPNFPKIMWMWMWKNLSVHCNVNVLLKRHFI